MTGRKIIVTSAKEITSENLLPILKNAFSEHSENQWEIRYLRDYYRGKQDILERTKTYRTEINNKIVENRAFEIVEFKKGYVFGEPVQFVRRGDCELTEEDENSPENTGVAALNEYLQAENKEAIDAQIAEDMHVCGTAFRLAFPKSTISETEKFVDEAPFIIAAMDPEYTFIIYSNTPECKPMLGVSYVQNVDPVTGEESYEVKAYSDTRVFTIMSDTFDFKSERSNIEEKPNGVGGIPIIEYPLNPSRLGCFENVLSLLDALNNVASNRMDGVEQFIQSFIKFKNCEIDSEDFERLKRDGALVIKGTPGLPADADIMASSLDQTQTQALVDELYQAVLTICGVPDREASAGGNTGQALKIGQGWANAETRAKATEVIFKRSERQFLKIILGILHSIKPERLPKGLAELRLSDIDFVFTRNNTDSLLVKTQGLLNLLDAGIHPRIAIEKVGLFSDPERVYQDSVELLDNRWKSQITTKGAAVPANNQPEDGEKLEDDPDSAAQVNS